MCTCVCVWRCSDSYGVVAMAVVTPYGSSDGDGDDGDGDGDSDGVTGMGGMYLT